MKSLSCGILFQIYVNTFKSDLLILFPIFVFPIPYGKNLAGAEKKPMNVP